MKRMSTAAAITAAMLFASGMAHAQTSGSNGSTAGGLASPGAGVPAGSEAGSRLPPVSPGANSLGQPTGGNLQGTPGSSTGNEVPTFTPDDLNSTSGANVGNSVPNTQGSGTGSFGVPSIMDTDGTGSSGSIDVTR